MIFDQYLALVLMTNVAQSVIKNFPPWRNFTAPSVCLLL